MHNSLLAAKARRLQIVSAAARRLKIGRILVSRAALSIVACASPVIEGGQITDPPPAFAYDGNCQVARVVFPGRERVRQRCWMKMREPYAAVHMTEFRGSSSRDDAEAGRAALEKRYREAEYSPLEATRIDRREAWLWRESQRSKQDGTVSSVTTKAVVSYPTATYAIEFAAQDPRYLDLDLQRQTLHSFRVIESGDVDVVKLLVAVLVFGGGYYGYQRMRGFERRDRFTKRPRS